MKWVALAALLTATPALAQQIDAWHQQLAKCRYDTMTWALAPGLDSVTAIGRYQLVRQRVTGLHGGEWIQHCVAEGEVKAAYRRSGLPPFGAAHGH